MPFLEGGITDCSNCSGLYFSPEREFLTGSITASRTYNPLEISTYPVPRLDFEFLKARSSIRKPCPHSSTSSWTWRTKAHSTLCTETHVNGRVRCRAYKGTFSVLGRSSSTEKLYDMEESSMDEIGDFGKAPIIPLLYYPTPFQSSNSIPHHSSFARAGVFVRHVSVNASKQTKRWLYVQRPARREASSAFKRSGWRSTAP